LVAIRDLGAVALEADGQELVDITGVVEQLERAAPQDQRLGLVGALRRLVDDTHGNAVTSQLVGQREADRAGANDENLSMIGHALLSPLELLPGREPSRLASPLQDGQRARRARSIAAAISWCASSRPPQPSSFTHLPGSRSL